MIHISLLISTILRSAILLSIKDIILQQIYIILLYFTLKFHIEVSSYSNILYTYNMFLSFRNRIQILILLIVLYELNFIKIYKVNKMKYNM